MRLGDLRQVLREVDPAAILVPPRILDRIIQRSIHLPTFIWELPHRRCFVVDRQFLFRYVDQEELELEPDRLLPTKVILLRRPTPDELNKGDVASISLKYWRLLFHARVHLALGELWADGKLGNDNVQHYRDELGQPTFDEIRTVLVQDHHLQPNADDAATLLEFAAVFLEMLYFAPSMVRASFPGLPSIDHIAKLLRRHLDSDQIFEETRLPDASEPREQTEATSDEAHEYFWRLIAKADRQEARGNIVEAAIMRRRAARVAPGDHYKETRANGVQNIRQLCKRLQEALRLSDEEEAGLERDLPILLDKADQGSRSVEAALLYDLEKLCLDYERDIFALDIAEWMLTVGQRPMKRRLPCLRAVRILNHLRSAARRLTIARLSVEDRMRLNHLLQTAVQHSAQRVRERFCPLIISALQDAGIDPANPPEEVAFFKVVEEILDRIIEAGFLTFSELRDTLSRNQLKLRDLTEPREFIQGDALLRLDRRLTNLLDGVYRPSQFYLRWLERLSALCFGTFVGRKLTMSVLVPFGAALILLEVINLVMGRTGGGHIPNLVFWPSVAALGFLILGIIHGESVRRRTGRAIKAVGSKIRSNLFDRPKRFFGSFSMGKLLKSWPAQLFGWLVVKPAFITLLVAVFWPKVLSSWTFAIGTFLLVNIVVNSHPGQAIEDLLFKGVYRLLELVRGGLIMNVVRFVIYVFKRFIHFIEAAVASVDDWLYFRTGESRLSMAMRGVLKLIWFPISYIGRFYVVVLVEPGINPVKLPVSFVAAKFIYPLGLFIVPAATEWLTPVFGSVGASLVSSATFFLLPDAFGFLFWETKENWSLYGANRSKHLAAVPVGPHGETTRGLLRPGFHSGRVPNLYYRLRRAQQDAHLTGNWVTVRAHRRSLEEIQEAVKCFVSRDLLELLHKAKPWSDKPLTVGHIVLMTNCIRVELDHEQFPDRPLRLWLEQQSNWLIAGIADSGWLSEVGTEARVAFDQALTAWYKLAGVDLVRAQVESAFPDRVCVLRVTGNKLRIREKSEGKPETFYDLNIFRPPMQPQQHNGQRDPDWPALQPEDVIFSRLPISWQEHVDSWKKLAKGDLGTEALRGMHVIPAEFLPAEHELQSTETNRLRASGHIQGNGK